MGKTFDQGKDEISKLCRYFETNSQAFLTPGIKEAHVRQSLIDPFFEALGWDVRNTAMAAPQYREVIPEDSLDVEGQYKAPDYTFRVGQTPKFLAEAKKCGINISADPRPAYQLRCYGWSAKVAFSILTDFQELGVYDCTMRPRQSDKASHARIQYFRFEEYPDRWHELWDVYSREAVWDGRFDQYAASKRKRGTSEVDVDFLKEIEGWRDALARNIALRNKDLSSDDLNAAVQRTIDRIVFLRMAEDRGIEPYEQLLKLCERPEIYARFMRGLCRRADEKYNSGLFHFQKESGISEAPDRITPKLTVDDKVFKPILQNLYFEHGCPYHFRALRVEILGTVYERFLGKVIRLTAGHQAKIEEKPEVRKAGGVYYTPAYIVDYIVKNTVGKQIEGKSPAKLAGIRGTGVSPVSAWSGASRKTHGRDGHATPPFRVLDMACGSGSFLLGAYQLLLDHCLKWYIEHKPATQKRAVYAVNKSGTGFQPVMNHGRDAHATEWRLTIEEKKRILTTHIFGVDIDPQAVEVTKLSLLLKVLEGETQETIQLDWLSFKDRALPNLADNIKCGNSLIGPDYFTCKLIPEPDEMKRVNPFDWKQGFPDAMKAGGFDCIIGNPPYVPIEMMSNVEKKYFHTKYPMLERKYDTSVVFILTGLTRLLPEGSLGYISSVTWQTGENFSMLRQYLFERAGVYQLINLPFDVFEQAYVDTGIYLLTKIANKEYRIFRFPKETKVANLDNIKWTTVPTRFVTGPDYKIVLDPTSQRILLRTSKYRKRFVALGEMTISTQGLAAGRFVRSINKPESSSMPFLEDGQVYRYELIINSVTRVDMSDKQSLKRFYQGGPKLLVRRIVNRQDRLMIGFTEKKMVFKKDINPFLLTDATLDLFYLLGILNSRLISYLYVNTSAIATKDDFRQTTLAELRRLPIYRHTNSSTAKIAQLAMSMLTLHKHLAAAKSEAQKDVIQRQIDATDAKIDRLVYELYQLTDEEIAIVEGEEH